MSTITLLVLLIVFAFVANNELGKQKRRNLITDLVLESLIKKISNNGDLHEKIASEAEHYLSENVPYDEYKKIKEKDTFLFNGSALYHLWALIHEKIKTSCEEIEKRNKTT